MRPRKELVLENLLKREQQEGFQVADSVRQRLERCAHFPGSAPYCSFLCIRAIHSAGVAIPTVTITYQNLTISANVEYGHRTLPTLPNTIIGICKVCGEVNALFSFVHCTSILSQSIMRPLGITAKPHRRTLLDNVSGRLEPVGSMH